MNNLSRLPWKFIFISRLILITLLYSGPATGAEVNCSLIKNECEFYSCLETKKNCGKYGYPLGFGKKYCLLFEKREHKFSASGNLFINKTRNCLIKTLLDSPKEVSCKALKRQAFKDHISCYIESGFCELSKSDKKNLYKIVWPTLWRGKVIRSGLKVKKHCWGLNRQENAAKK